MTGSPRSCCLLLLNGLNARDSLRIPDTPRGTVPAVVPHGLFRQPTLPHVRRNDESLVLARDALPIDRNATPATPRNLNSIALRQAQHVQLIPASQDVGP